MRYEAPESLDTAVALLAGPGAMPALAGHRSVRPDARRRGPRADRRHQKIPETRAVAQEKGGWRVGAAVTGAELKENAALRKAWPGVVEAANLIGSTQIQGRATMGGNLCNGSPAADSVPALIAAGAVATVAGPKGRRDIPVEDVMLGREAPLTKGEFLVSSSPPAPRARASLPTVHPRTEMDIAVVARVSHDRRRQVSSRGARVAGRGGREGAAGARGGDPIIRSILDRPADRLSSSGARAAPAIDDKRGTVEFGPGRGRAHAPRGPDRNRAGEGELN